MRRTAEEALRILLDTLDNVEADANGHNACCPAHDDSKNSLHFAVGDDGRLLINCKAGCTVPEVLYAVDVDPPLTMSECFPETEKKRGRKRKLGRVVEEYDYFDETGKLRFQVCRLDPKDFQQRRPDGDGGWVWGLSKGYYYQTRRGWFRIGKNKSPGPEHRHFPAVERLLYRLPELIKSTQPVFVVEGEKDVDRLYSLGAVATCNPGGGGKWAKAYSQSLADRDVVIVPDNDKTGEDHADAVLGSLAGVASSVRVLRLPELPEKGDVSDWLDAGGTIQQLCQLASEQPEQTSLNPTKDSDEKPPAEAPEIANGIKDGDDVVPVCMEQITNQIDQLTQGWPRRVGESLFISGDNHRIHWVNKTADFYAFLGRHAGPPKFYRTAGCHTKEEVVSDWRRHCTAYRAIETLPHEPTLPDHFYAHEPIEPGDGKVLDDFLQRFSPETDTDLDLIKAMFATPLWGGRGGSRPAFVITSDAGRGSGKSTIISLMAHLFGGLIDLSPREDIGVLKQRLLSTEALPLRVAVLDNVKTLRFSWGELESLITSPTISGKRLYVGEDSRPNTLMYVITLNGVALSTDMAQRSVIIKLKRPKHVGPWEQETREFIDRHRQQLLADLVGFLQADRVEGLESYSRWSAWEHAIVERLPVPSYAQSLYLARQAEADVEKEETEMVEEFVRQKLEELPARYSEQTYDCDRDRIFIPSKILANWYRQVSLDSHSEIATIRQIKPRVAAGDFACIHELKDRRIGRGFQWIGLDHSQNPNQSILTDLNDRVEQQKFF